MEHSKEDRKWEEAFDSLVEHLNRVEENPGTKAYGPRYRFWMSVELFFFLFEEHFAYGLEIDDYLREKHRLPGDVIEEIGRAYDAAHICAIGPWRLLPAEMFVQLLGRVPTTPWDSEPFPEHC